MAKIDHDNLLHQAARALAHSGSYKTRYNHSVEVKRFVKILRAQGFGVKKWEKVTNKHVRAVVSQWKSRGLKPATMKEYLSGVRAVARYYGNDRIAAKNAAFHIPNRVYVSNQDKCLSDHAYNTAITALKESMDPNDHRVAAQMQLQRELGLRMEESYKFSARRDVLADGRVLIAAGAKGGRERVILVVSDKGWEAIEYARQVGDGRNGNIMPREMSERQWNSLCYRILRRNGVTIAKAGASSHGLRHAYAQERYRQITGFECRAKFGSQEEFRAAARNAAGTDWARLDHDARQVLKPEMGHGPDRKDVVSQYLGSSTS